MKSRILTLQQLIDIHACGVQVDLFKKTFGDEVKVTVALAKKYAQHFDFEFASRYLLSAPARAEYGKITAAAWAEYLKVVAPALAEYKKVKVPARAEYDKVVTPALAEYDKVEAAAWANAYINDMEK